MLEPRKTTRVPIGLTRQTAPAITGIFVRARRSRLVRSLSTIGLTEPDRRVAVRG